MAGENGGSSQEKQYDYLLKFLLVGDSDVGKQEILSGLEDGSTESPYWNGYGNNIIRFFVYYAFIVKYTNMPYESVDVNINYIKGKR
jgi:hypothetical protein